MGERKREEEERDIIETQKGRGKSQREAYISTPFDFY